MPHNSIEHVPWPSYPPLGKAVRTLTPKLQKVKWCGGLLLLLLCASLCLSSMGFFPWSRLNCWQYDVDIQSGRMRCTRHLLFLPIKQSVEDSALSKLIESADVKPSPDWHSVMTLSPNVHHSPHYAFHGAMSQFGQLERVWNMGGFTPEVRKAAAKAVLELWQKNGSYFEATRYLNAVVELAAASTDKHEKIEVSRLPRP
jgi:hypothetical protein